MRLTFALPHLIISILLVSTRPLAVSLPTVESSISGNIVRDGRSTASTTNYDSTPQSKLSSMMSEINTHTHYLQRRLSGTTVAKVAATVGVLGILGLAFEESGRYVRKVTAPPDEGAFTPQQEQIVKTWLQTKPTQLWEGDQVMQRIQDTPNISQREIDMFTTKWKERQGVIMNMTEIGNFTMASATLINSEGLDVALPGAGAGSTKLALRVNDNITSSQTLPSEGHRT